MADAIRTRCKFRVVSVEQVDHPVKTEKVYDDDPDYSSVAGYESPEADGRKSKLKPVAWAENVQLAAQYDPGNQEDLSFSEATPSGNLKIYVSNKNVVGSFRVGHCYYLDLIPC